MVLPIGVGVTATATVDGVSLDCGARWWWASRVGRRSCGGHVCSVYLVPAYAYAYAYVLPMDDRVWAVRYNAPSCGHGAQTIDSAVLCKHEPSTEKHNFRRCTASLVNTDHRILCTPHRRLCPRVLRRVGCRLMREFAAVALLHASTWRARCSAGHGEKGFDFVLPLRAPSAVMWVIAKCCRLGR